MWRIWVSGSITQGGSATVNYTELSFWLSLLGALRYTLLSQPVAGRLMLEPGSKEE